MIDTLAMLTTAANEVVAPLHERTSLIPPREAHQLWPIGEPEVAAKLMVPAPGTSMAAHRVSDRVNKPQQQGAELIAVVEG